ncbi:hypothetical protein [Acinetobacter sp.]|uniref:hypothetical protein n=1 Tax=Acinetobacter sp. TaxID=472 RepID=UPI0035B2E087
MANNTQNSTIDLSQEQIQSLITTSTGFLDVYEIPVHGDVPILIPQNMILSAMSVKANEKQVEWHDKQLPTYVVHQPDLSEVTALVVEGEQEATHFALLCDSMPKSLRLRISEVVDVEKKTPARTYQYVRVNGVDYQVPNLRAIQQQVFK